MTRIEALKIFNLSEGYTEEQVKKVYKKLIKENHPDGKQNLTDEEIKTFDEKAKKITEAFDLLYDKKNHRVRTGYYYNNTNYAQQPSFDLEKYKENIIKAIEFRIGKTKNPIIKEYYDNTFLVLSVMIITNDTKAAVDEAYKKVNKKVIQKFKEFKVDYFLEWDLIDDHVHEEINYEADFDTFYKQLESIKRKYSAKYQLVCLIDQETAKYKLYALYNDQIKELIEVAKNNALKNAKKTNYQNLDAILLEIHQEIEEIFTTISNIQEMIKRLSSEIPKLNNKELSSKLQKIINCYKEGKALSTIERDLQTLEQTVGEVKSQKETIEKKIKKLNKMTEKLNDTTYLLLFRAILMEYNEDVPLSKILKDLIDLEEKIKAKVENEERLKKEDNIIKEIFLVILTKFTIEMSKLHPVKNHYQTVHLTEIFNKILDLFKKYREGNIDIKTLKSLSEIGVENLEYLEIFLNILPAYNREDPESNNPTDPDSPKQLKNSLRK